MFNQLFTLMLNESNFNTFNDLNNSQDSNELTELILNEEINESSTENNENARVNDKISEQINEINDRINGGINEGINEEINEGINEEISEEISEKIDQLNNNDNPIEIQTTIIISQQGNEDINEKICRICLESENPDNMIAPCRCSGHSKYVHRYCLDTWRSQNVNSENFKKCRECLFEYRLQDRQVLCPICKKILNFFSKYTVVLYLSILIFIFMLSLFYKSIGITSIGEPKYIWGIYIYEDNKFLAILTFLIFTIIMLITHDIYMCLTYRSLREYYRNYANCGLFTFILFFFSTIILFFTSPIFGTIAVTLLLQAIIRYILEIRYNYSLVEERPVLDLDTLELSEQNALL